MTTIHDNWPSYLVGGIVYAPYFPLYATCEGPEQFEFSFVSEFKSDKEYQQLMYFDNYSWFSNSPII